jgi:hypothetical protein
VAELDEMDVTVHRLVVEEVATHGGDAVALVRQEWSDPAGLWFTEVEPRCASAAKISIAYQDEDTLTVAVGHIWFEMFGPVSDNLPELRQVVRAVLEGRVEESGSTSNAFGRIGLESGTLGVGAMHLPLPWKWRQVRRYDAYSQG